MAALVDKQLQKFEDKINIKIHEWTLSNVQACHDLGPLMKDMQSRLWTIESCQTGLQDSVNAILWRLSHLETSSLRTIKEEGSPSSRLIVDSTKSIP